MKTILPILIISLTLTSSIFSQTSVLDWGSVTISGYSQTVTLPTGQTATMTYSSPNNVSYKTSINLTEFAFGPTNASCDGISNSGDPSAYGVFLFDDYDSDYTAAIAGKDWKISFSDPLTDVDFDIYDISSLMHSSSYPDATIGVYNDKVIVSGKDNNGNTIYPILSNIGTTFVQGLDNLVSDCSIVGGTYEGQGYAGDVDLEEFVVDNTAIPPTAYVSAGTINSSTGVDSDCFSAGFFYSMDINVDFGTQNVSEITIKYHNYDNGLLGSQDASGASCLQVFTGMAGQAVLFGDIAYSVAVLPIELVSFEGKSIEKDNHLKWTTASEINNDFFSVVHSMDGIEFKEIGSIEGISNSTNFREYNYAHKNAPTGSNYYRLDQYDLDGTSSSSNVIVVYQSAFNDISIYPTISNGKYTVQGIQENDLVEIYSLNGILQKTIKYSEEILDLDISELNTGIYFVKITGPSIFKTLRVFKE